MGMQSISSLEHSLLLCPSGNGQFRRVLFSYLDDGISLASLRATSRVLQDIVSWTLCSTLYMRAPLAETDDVQSVQRIAKYCRCLTIQIGTPDYADHDTGHESGERQAPRDESLWWHFDVRKTFSSKKNVQTQSSWNKASDTRHSEPRVNPSPSVRPRSQLRSSEPSSQSTLTLLHRQNLETRLWMTILSKFQSVGAITLRIYGGTTWPGRTAIEDTLVTLRIAIEYAQFKSLHSLKLQPIHAMGIIHLRWSGLNAFGASPGPGAKIWQKLQILDLWLYNPLKAKQLSEMQTVMFKKTMYDYLCPLARTLKCLRFVWLESEGPSPLALHLHMDYPESKSSRIKRLESPNQPREAIRWPKLQELWVGNIHHPYQTIRLVSDVAPNLVRLMTLRSTHNDGMLHSNSCDLRAWMEILLGEERSDVANIDHGSSTSSVYSQSDARSGTVWEGGISRNSRVVPFVLDF